MRRAKKQIVSFLPSTEPVPLLGDAGASHFFRSKMITLERVSDLSPIWVSYVVHHYRLPLGLLLCLLLGLLLPSDLLLLPSSIDISSQCSVVLPRLLKFFLDWINLFSNFWIWKWTYTFSNYTKQLKSRSSSYELTSLTWGHSSL
jgi:hypothetical protein